jgi:hypothetical protein
VIHVPGHIGGVTFASKMSNHPWYVQYSDEFAEQLIAAPRWLQDEFEEMYAQLCEDPRQSAAHAVEQSVADADEFHMEFDWPLAWITYRVDDAKRMVKIAFLMNAKDP